MTVYNGVRITLSLLIILFGNAGRVLVFGGRLNDQYLASLEMLSTDRQTWETLPTPMYKAVSHFLFVAEAGEGFGPNPERKPCPPTLGDTKGARRGKRQKRGGAVAPNPQNGEFFFFCSF